MVQVAQLCESFKQGFQEQLREARYLYADTRIRRVTLYDHLALTAALAVAMTVELLRRGQNAQSICGVNLSETDLRALSCLCGLAHDIGKARLGTTEYRQHVPRGVEYMQEWLDGHGVEEPLSSIVVGVVARHHLRDGPQTRLEQIVCLADSYASAGDRPELGRAETREQFERAIRETERLEQELFGKNKPVCLLLADVDAIKSYVYETQALPEIRGGSELLQDVERKIQESFRQELAEENLIYCGGGGLLAIVPASEAEAWKQRIERLYLQQTRLATVTVVASEPIGYTEMGRGLVPHDAESARAVHGQGVAQDLLLSHFGTTDPARRKNFGELVAYLTGKLQQAKRQKSVGPFIEALPVHHRCESCGKRPASVWDDVRAERLCVVCSAKRKKGRKERRSFVEDFFRWSEERTSRTGPDDLDNLAGEEGRIALLYADGNNMGELLQQAPSPASYRHISEALSTATRQALFQALQEVFGEKLREKLPFEIIALGGDDIVVLLPASAGWAVTLRVLDNFARGDVMRRLQEELQEWYRTDRTLSLSAGLAVADVKYPVRFLFDLAEGLLKEAKRLARETQTATLCHLWLRAPIVSEDAREMLRALYEREHPAPERHLTARPYTLEQAQQLTRVAQQLAEIPVTQLRALGEALEKGVHVSLNYALYQAARVHEAHRERLRNAFEQLGSLVGGDQGFWFWRQQQGVWRTALLDALELIELNAHTEVAHEHQA
jgi:GGDEF domain-containing protein